MPSSLPAPTRAFTPGLEFDEKPYYVSKIDTMREFHRNVLRVRQYIASRLTEFTGLDGVIELRLGDGMRYSTSPIYVESALFQARLLDTVPSDAELSEVVTVMPEYIIDIIEGRMHAVHAFGKYATPPCRGRFPLCFAPGGRPKLVACVDELDQEALPKPTDDIEQVKIDLTEWGYALVKNALSQEQCNILRKAVEEQAAGERIAQVAHMDGAHKDVNDEPNQRVWSLANKGEEFRDLLNHPLIDAIMPWFLGNAFKLHSMGANIARAAKSGIYNHRDQMGLAPETFHHAYLLNALWYLVDVTEENGATRIYPGSHNKNVAPPAINTTEGSIAAAAPAGTVMLLDSRTWHSTGVNTSTGTRPIILQAFCRFFLQPMENYPEFMDEGVKQQLSDRQLSLLGFPLAGSKGQRVQAYTAYNFPGSRFGKARAPSAGNQVLELEKR